MPNNYYAGIGSQETPQSICDLMVEIAGWLCDEGWILRSGGARGADTAFEVGARGKARIFRAEHATLSSLFLAEMFHPAWHKCSPNVKNLHARNGLILLGKELTNPDEFVKFVACWTPNGAIAGGTGQGLRIAEHYGIPVFNLFNADAARNLYHFVRGQARAN